MMRMTKEEIMTIVTFLLKMMLALIIIIIGLMIFFDDIYDDDDANESISVTQIRNSCFRLSDMFVYCLVFRTLVSDHPLACR